MLNLDKSLHAWGTPDFEAILKQEVAQSADRLPLQQCLASTSHVTDAPITLVIHSMAEMEKVIRIRAGIFFQGVIGGCSCADDPTPISEITEYCEVQLDIDRVTAITAIAIVPDEQPSSQG